MFAKDSGEDSIEVRVQDGDVWLTQKAIAQLFDVERSVITKHLKNILDSGELNQKAVCAKFAQTADDGKTYQYKFYALSAIVAIGYRVFTGLGTFILEQKGVQHSPALPYYRAGYLMHSISPAVFSRYQSSQR